MFEPDKITGIGAAFIAGAITSVHCMGMCGPLASAFYPRKGSDSNQFLLSSVYYHLARVFSYGIIGAIAGGIGRAPLDYFSASPVHLFPWAIVAFFLIVALGLDQKFPRPLFITQGLFHVRSLISKWPETGIGAAIGFLTPLLPCGPLYLIFFVSLLSGSAIKGAEFSIAFSMGTIPLLWLAQHQILRWSSRIPFLSPNRIQRICALLAAVMISWRLWGGTLHLPTQEAPPSCPLCHEKSSHSNS